MPHKTPIWFPWLSPVCAILGAWLIGVNALEGGFWAIVFVAAISAILPFILFRIGFRLHLKFQNG